MNLWNELKRALPALPPVSLWMLPSRIDQGAKAPAAQVAVGEGRLEPVLPAVREIFLNGKRVRVR